MTDLIQVNTEGCSIATTPEAMEVASNLHTELQEIKTVPDAAAQVMATERAVNAQRFLKQLEANRKDVKAPVIELGKRIDALAAELSAPVRTEMERVGKLVAGFQQAEAIRVATEKQLRDDMERRAIEAKFDADALAKTAAAGVQTEADLAKAIEAEVIARQAEKDMYAQLTAPTPTVQKASGSVTKKVLKFEVTDIVALFRAAPHLVKLEPNVTAIKSTCTPATNLPGIRLWEETETSFRT